MEHQVDVPPTGARTIRYFSDLENSIYIISTPHQEVTAQAAFAAEVPHQHFVTLNIQLGCFTGIQEELETWVAPQVE